MALRWEKHADGVCYQVRTAGNTVRLYTNGVLHTQYNPTRLLTGSVWDLLLLGALFVPRERMRRVLLLGVGGGAIIQQLRQVFPDVLITGIELNPVHIAIARRFFGVRSAQVDLVCENAITWLTMYDGEPFDLIIDDLFGEHDGIPCRAVAADADWLGLLATHLTADGVLVTNFAGRREVRACAWQGSRGLRRRFPAAISLATPSCENRVVAFLPRLLGPEVLRAAQVADARLRGRLLCFSARRLR